MADDDIRLDSFPLRAVDKLRYADTEAHYDKTFGLNARGLLFTAQKALPLTGRGGSIILIGSIAAFKGFPAHTIQARRSARPFGLGSRSWEGPLMRPRGAATAARRGPKRCGSERALPNKSAWKA
jgi:NAD(P)-dependent dehydrogenase (short-subunit alcohol dehydrogenase family)